MNMQEKKRNIMHWANLWKLRISVTLPSNTEFLNQEHPQGVRELFPGGVGMLNKNKIAMVLLFIQF